MQVLSQQSGKTNDVWLKECRSTFTTMISHKADREASEANTQVGLLTTDDCRVELQILQGHENIEEDGTTLAVPGQHASPFGSQVSSQCILARAMLVFMLQLICTGCPIL